MHYDLTPGKRLDYRLIQPGDSVNGWTFLEKPRTTQARVRVRCRCGREKDHIPNNLLRGQTSMCKSCSVGELKRVHGGKSASGDRLTRWLYSVWKGVKWRCNPRNTVDAANYFERGITVCPEWRDDFPAFYRWAVQAGYEPGLTIDRVDNSAGYHPDNCRWATWTVQARNTRWNRLISAFGLTKPVVEWAEDARCRVPLSTLRMRLQRGMDPEHAMTSPFRRSVDGRYVKVQLELQQ